MKALIDLITGVVLFALKALIDLITGVVLFALFTFWGLPLALWFYSFFTGNDLYFQFGLCDEPTPYIFD